MQGREEIILQQATDIFVDDALRLRATVTLRNLDPARQYVLRVVEVDRNGQWVAGQRIRPAYPMQFHGPWGVEIVDGDAVSGEAPRIDLTWTAGIIAAGEFEEGDRIRVVAVLFEAESGDVAAISRMTSARARCSTTVSWRGKGGRVGSTFKPTVTVRCAAPYKNYNLTVAEADPIGHPTGHLASKSRTVPITTDENGDWAGEVEFSTVVKAGDCFVEATCAGATSGPQLVTFG